MRRWFAVALLVLVALPACRDRAERLNIRPPRPGVPADRSDVVGIYRSIHQGLLQLRGDGDLTLIVPDGPGATSGSYALRDGRLEVRTQRCGDQVGDYRVEVTGEQEPGKALLNLTAVDDPCDERRRYLTIDPWVYANS
jgi:hypothetical protein